MQQLSCTRCPVSAVAILHTDLVTAGSRTSSVGCMRTDIFQWLLPSPTHPFPSSRGPSAPAPSHYVSEMFGGLSVPACRTVSKHNVSQWASSQFVCKCVCVCVRDCFFFLCAKFLFFHNLNTRGSCYSLEAVHTNARIWMTLNFQMTVVTPTFAYISFKYVPMAETKI